MRSRVLSIVVGLVVAAPLPAQGTFRTAGREIGEVASDFFYVWGAPFHASGESWVAAAVTGAMFAALLPVDDDVDRWTREHPNAAVVVAISPFGDKNPGIARLVMAQRLAPFSGALFLTGLVTDRRGLREAGAGCVSGWLVSNSLRHAIYEGVSRMRPSLAKGDQYTFDVPGGPWGEHSFFGGHAMNAFACATFWNERFELGVLEPLLYAAATGFSLARVTDGHHWASDTFLGIVLGYATGRTIANRYEEREARRESRASRMGAQLVPLESGTALVVALSF